MSQIKVSPKKEFVFQTDEIASDKSISHRCAIFSLLSDKPSHVRNFLNAEDTLCTLSIAQSLGAKVEKKGDTLIITPPLELKEPASILDCGNSGTAIRLLMGFLSSLDGFYVLHGDKYLVSRPMKRVANPLRKIGAIIDGRSDGELAPISIRGAHLKPFHYDSPIASAQVKSALILAGLRAKGTSTLSEPTLSRDHTEKMLRGMGVDIKSDGCKVTLNSINKPLKPLDITVPNDPSSGFFFAVAAAITPNSKVILKNMLLNPTRIEAYEVLKRMGAKVEFIEKESTYDSVGDIVVEYAPLTGVTVKDNIAWLIDELPALSIAFATATGKSVVKNAKELRVKESDRISSVVENLKKCGLHVEEFEDGYEVTGGELQSATVDSYGDHRVAMSFAIAGLKVPMNITDTECIQTSFPNFIELLSQIGNVK
ncbi:3-phosphoshikimate 1-carboxyvinyltransferase [Sulfurospirillum arcachonense]|uniref:3-phosphoshikimate 1-carboxyvinyltransferase n=1 Tax=Sulfurospirillum arcachonense TaxID=57666 RepID=UPI000469E99E|nr:3-phosphoshikimate 1-carboxyvinyltransferase [Sulfurospirillum arcachonense]